MSGELRTAIMWILAVGLVFWGSHAVLCFSAWQWRHGNRKALALHWVVVLIVAGALWTLRQPYALGAVFLWMGIWFRIPRFLTPSPFADWMSRKRWAEVRRQSWLHIALGVGSGVFILPFLWLLSTSLKYDDQMKAFPPQFVPMKAETARVRGVEEQVYLLGSGDEAIRVTVAQSLSGGRVRVLPVGVSDPARAQEVSLNSLHEIRRFRPRWENYTEALAFLPAEYQFGLVPLANTVYVTVLSILGLLLSSSLAAYAFSRLRWPGREVFFVILLATMMLPAAVTMLPVFLIFRWLGWIDTLRPLWVPAFLGSAFNIFLLRQFFMTIPMELEEAAKIDGCSPFTTYWRIMLPLVKPALAAVTIMAFMGSWNNFMGPLIYINSPEKMPLSYALYLFQGMHGGEQGMLMAAATMVMLPVLTVFFFTQRYFIQGITLTGLKG